MIGGDLDTLTNQFNALFNLAGRQIGNGGLPPVENKIIDDIVTTIEDEDTFVPTTPSKTKKFTNLGQSFAESLDPLTKGVIGTGGGGNTIITVNTGALLGSEQDVQNAVVTALEQAKRKGITVAQ